MTNSQKNLPARSKSGGKGDFLSKIRAGKVTGPAPSSATPTKAHQDAMIAAALQNDRQPRLVFAVDATGSRKPTWDAARPLTARLFDALPGELEIALAVHGGDRVHTFTEFSDNKATFKKVADEVKCEGGLTKLVPIMSRTATLSGVKVLLYIGDAFEESAVGAEEAAAALRAKGTKMIIMQDNATPVALAVFRKLANITGGAVLPFHPSQADAVGDIMQAVALLAGKGMKALQSQAKALPAAALLLQHLKPS